MTPSPSFDHSVCKYRSLRLAVGLEDQGRVMMVKRGGWSIGAHNLTLPPGPPGRDSPMGLMGDVVSMGRVGGVLKGLFRGGVQEECRGGLPSRARGVVKSGREGYGGTFTEGVG
eukprot:749446-Hanusia_phi.AAC.4